MDNKTSLEDMRPYRDDEVRNVIKRLEKDQQMVHILKFINPDCEIEEIMNKFKNINTIEEFQNVFSSKAVEYLINTTTDGLTYNGLENLNTNETYLFIANHRDIVMDSAIMQWLLKVHGFRTSQITFGSNLMYSQFIIDLGKMNKMFTFYRSNTKIGTYRNALLHSKYIRQVIIEQHQSIWIAQHDGRTKDGNDYTQAALIKMLLFKQNDLFKALKELNIVPVVVSYEKEPCDVYKLKEIYNKKVHGGKYTKSENEDLTSILNGITSQKGRVHMSFGKPVNNFLNEVSHSKLELDKIANLVAMFIDKEVFRNYKLYPYNYIAFDVKHESTIFLDKQYSANDIDKFNSFLLLKMTSEKCDKDIPRDIFERMFLNMYAAPVENYLKLEN